MEIKRHFLPLITDANNITRQAPCQDFQEDNLLTSIPIWRCRLRCKSNFPPPPPPPPAPSVELSSSHLSKEKEPFLHFPSLFLLRLRRSPLPSSFSFSPVRYGFSSPSSQKVSPPPSSSSVARRNPRCADVILPNSKVHLLFETKRKRVETPKRDYRRCCGPEPF